MFKRSLRLHTKEAVHRYRKWVEAVTLPEASLQVLTNFFLIRRQESLLWRLVLVREGVSVHDTHVANNVYTSLPEAADH